MSQLSTEESIVRLKAEILAQDWRISPKRTEMIGAALLCLQQHYQERKATHAMLIMALSVLDYIRQHGSNPPETVDFLKEAMAHVVGQYEDLEYRPSQEEQIFRSLFTHFTKLKELIKTGKKSAPQKRTPAPAALPPQPNEPHEPSAPLPPEDNKPQTERTNLLEGIEAEKLINDLRNSLAKAGEVGSTIGDLLEQLIESQQTKGVNQPDPLPVLSKLPTQTATLKATVQKSPAQEIRDQSSPGQGSASSLNSCPPTELRQLSIGNLKLAVQESLIAAIKPMKPKKMAAYIKKSHVPAKDFGSFLQNLSSQFKGPLGKLKPKKLKKIDLPIMVPQGLDLPETPDPQAQNLLILSNGSWHGIIACGKVEQCPQSMVQFRKNQNGDIAGTGYLENEEEILLLDSLSILRREGYLIMPS